MFPREDRVSSGQDLGYRVKSRGPRWPGKTEEPWNKTKDIKQKQYRWPGEPQGLRRQASMLWSLGRSCQVGFPLQYRVFLIEGISVFLILCYTGNLICLSIS